MNFRHCAIAVVVYCLITRADPQLAAFASEQPTSHLNSFSPQFFSEPDPAAQPGVPARLDAPVQSENNLDDLKIVVLEGEDGTNIIKKQTAVQPVVEVRDRNNLPVAGAVVLFTTPSFGPSGVFVNGGRTFSVVTDSAGRAAVTGMKPTGGTGTFKINVSAHAAAHTGNATISQTNVLKPTGASASSGPGLGLTPGRIAIIGGIAAAAAVGLAVGLTRGSGGTATSGSAQPTGTIGNPGTPSITGPH